MDEAKSEESLAVALTGKNQSISTIGTTQTCGKTSQAQCWYQTQAVQISDMRQVSDGLVGQVTAQANSLAASSLRSAIIISVATLLLLILVLLITTFVARSMIRPLRKLRADALEVAGSKLPDMVRRLSESEGGDDERRDRADRRQHPPTRSARWRGPSTRCTGKRSGWRPTRPCCAAT